MEKRKKKLAELMSGNLKTYIAIVAVVCLIFSVYSLVVITSLYKETARNNDKVAMYFNTELEKILNGIGDIASNIIYNSYSLTLVSFDSGDSFTQEELNCAGNLKKDIYSCSISSSLIEDIMEYFPYSDRIIGKNGYFSSNVYFRSKLMERFEDATDENFLRWKETLFTHDTGGFYCEADMMGEPVIYYYCSVPFPLEKTSQRMVVIEISLDGLKDILTDLMQRGGYCYIALTDENSRVFSEYGDLPFNSTDELYQRQRNYSTSIVESELWSLRCVTVQEHRAAYRIVRAISFISAAALILTGLTGLFSALYFSEQNHKRVRKIASRFSDGVDTVPTLDYIAEKIDTLIANNQSIMSEADRQQRVIDYSFLKELLHSNSLTSEDLNLLATIYDEEFNGSMFMLAAVRHKNEDIINRAEIYSAISKYETPDLQIFFTYCFDAMVFLFNYNSEKDRTGVESLIQEIAGHGNSVDDREVFFGEIVHSPMQIRLQWEELTKKIWSNDDIEEYKSHSEEDGENELISEGSRDIAGLVHDILVNEYSNPQISLQVLSDRIGVSQVYLSKRFKQEYGVSVLRYINYLRIEAVKTMIMNGSDNLQTIAEKVGFTSDVNLIRVFKKYENITPGQFRAKDSN